MKKHLTNLMKRGFAAVLSAMMLTALILPAGPFTLTAQAAQSSATMSISLGNGSNAQYQFEAVDQNGDAMELFAGDFWAGVMKQSGSVSNGDVIYFEELLQKHAVVAEDNPYQNHYEYDYTEYVDGGYRARGLEVNRSEGGFLVIDENDGRSAGIGSGTFRVHVKEKGVSSERIHIEVVNGNNANLDGRVDKDGIVNAFLNGESFTPEQFILTDETPYKVLGITLQRENGLPEDVAGKTIDGSAFKSKDGSVTLRYRLKDVHFNLKAVTERGEELFPGNLGAFYELTKFENDVMNADAAANPEFVFASYAETQGAINGMQNRKIAGLKEVYIENDPSMVVRGVTPFTPVDGKNKTRYIKEDGTYYETENRDVTLVFETNESTPITVVTYNWEEGDNQLPAGDATFFDVAAFERAYNEYYNAKGVENTLHIADFSKHMMRKVVNGQSEWVPSPDGKAHLGTGDDSEGATHEIVQVTVHRKDDRTGHRVQVTDIVFGADGSVTFFNNGKEVGKRREVENWMRVFFYENLVTEEEEFTKIPTADSWSEEIYLYMFDYNMADEANKFLGYGNGGYAQYKEKQALSAEARGASWGYADWNGQKKVGMTELLMAQRYAGKGNLFPALNGASGNTLAMWFDPDENGAAYKRMQNGQIHGIYKANYLFTKDELGYYRYDSALNFARLRTDLGGGDNDVYSFEVYDQIATPNESMAHLTANAVNKNGKGGQLSEFFFQRGNFMPFNSMQKVKLPADADANGNATEFTRDNLVNQTHGISKYDANGVRLEQTAANYNKAIYQIQESAFNYRNGMYMVTEFLQPAGGKVQGEDMVFNFTGDDDMWVFIDGVLILDLGGIHDAQTGRINFATGEVTYTMNWNEGATNPRFVERKTTIRDQFKAAGQEKLAQWGTGEYVNTFSNYSTHRFQVFYMERGLSASNLQIEFNLMPAPKNFVAVEKEIEGMPEGVTDEADFRFQLQYYDESAKDWVPYPDAEFTKELSNTARKELGIGESMTLGRFNMMANRKSAEALQTKLGANMEKNAYDFAVRVNEELTTGSTLKTDANGMFSLNVMERAVFRTLHMYHNAEYIRVVELVPDNTHKFNYHDDPTYQFVRAERDKDTNEILNDGTGDYSYKLKKTEIENTIEWKVNKHGAYEGIYTGSASADGDLTGREFAKGLEKRGNVLPENGTILVVVKNKVDLREGIKLQKNVTGGYGSVDHGFTFTVELMDKNGQPLGDRDLTRLRILHGRETLNVGSSEAGLAAVDYSAEDIEAMRDLTVLPKTVFNFKLMSREYVIFERLPENVQFKVIEIKANDPEAQGYITTHKVTIKKHQGEDGIFKRETKDLTQEDRVGDYTATYNGEDIIKLDDTTDYGAEVIVTNNRDIVRTGLNMSTVPFILMVGFAALAIGGLAVITIRRRSMNIED
ncbi:MAG: hypothetical protein IJR58_02715 [Lachnospiraceae bacterium]|nr:hypothetical protein [Lachnospiraceae bacterium]